MFCGYLLGVFLMIGAVLVEAWIGVQAERKSLEAITSPLPGAPRDCGCGGHHFCIARIRSARYTCGLFAISGSFQKRLH